MNRVDELETYLMKLLFGCHGRRVELVAGRVESSVPRAVHHTRRARKALEVLGGSNFPGSHLHSAHPHLCPSSLSAVAQLLGSRRRQYPTTMSMDHLPNRGSTNVFGMYSCFLFTRVFVSFGAHELTMLDCGNQCATSRTTYPNRNYERFLNRLVPLWTFAL